MEVDESVILRLLAQHLVPDQLHAAKAAGAESLDHVEVIEAVKREALDSMSSLLNGIEPTPGGF